MGNDLTEQTSLKRNILSKSQEMIYPSFEHGGIVLSEENITVDHDSIKCHSVTQRQTLHVKRKVFQQNFI